MKLFNGYVLGTSGGGKSFDVKVRKADDFAFDEPIVIDPEKLGVDVAAKCINGKDPLHAVVLGGVFTPYGPLLTDDYGRSIRFAEYGDGPCRFGDRPIQVMKPYEWLADRVYVFDDEAVASSKHDVFRFVVEACRCFVGGDGDHDRSVVLCREGVAEQLDLSPMPSRRWSGLTAMPSVSATSRVTACAASARPIPKKALVCSMYGLSEAPPTKRFWDHAPMSVGLRKP